MPYPGKFRFLVCRRGGMADALRSGRSPLTRVKVQVLSSAPFLHSILYIRPIFAPHFLQIFILCAKLCRNVPKGMVTSWKTKIHGKVKRKWVTFWGHYEKRERKVLIITGFRSLPVNAENFLWKPVSRWGTATCCRYGCSDWCSQQGSRSGSN